ncbi:hypothetical protein QBC41DRAFT_329368 [Cercophora samala]|uniref:Uncharacterized protein n=1 Tax=Cercophora samala TaxID=330535 RepID=A0AA40D623_9PEZI|nr:hypothetical protein QBC41DRAFT_329368 [Cercophora samala]
MAYIAPIHRPSSVHHALLANVYSEEEQSLVLSCGSPPTLDTTNSDANRPTMQTNQQNRSMAPFPRRPPLPSPYHHSQRHHCHAPKAPTKRCRNRSVIRGDRPLRVLHPFLEPRDLPDGDHKCDPRSGRALYAQLPVPRPSHCRPIREVHRHAPLGRRPNYRSPRCPSNKRSTTGMDGTNPACRAIHQGVHLFTQRDRSPNRCLPLPDQCQCARFETGDIPAHL